MYEMPPQPTPQDQTKNHIEALMASPETIDALDVSFLFVELGYEEFTKVFDRLIEAHGRETGQDLRVKFIFNIDDPQIEKQWRNKVLFLRNLKAFLEKPKYHKHIIDITVKGPAGTVELEPNVFSSEVKFELIQIAD
ncbi:MAG: hypothetical protein HY461_03105 [Parcubacteria group bacterium]|nr:hypothetical protein [Parcubacteria group bacterium]